MLRNAHRAVVLPGLLCLAAAVACMPPIAAPKARSGTVQPQRPDDTVLIAESIALGHLRPGAAGGAVLVVRNPNHAPETVATIETSCPCLSVGPVPLQIGPGGSGRLTVRFDPSDEPSFRGALAVEIVGKGAHGELLFRGQVDFTVTQDMAQ